MMEKITIGIVGYGNLGRGVESAIGQNPDMVLKAVFTRRDPGTVRIAGEGVPVLPVDKAGDYTGVIDVMILCGGSATDLPEQSPRFARMFNVVDSYDTHARIPEHYSAVDEAARTGEKAAAVCIGWDPGLFSLNRMMAGAILPDGKDYTFWGRGLSQGHSDAVRRVPGVKGGVQYTIPIESAVEKVRRGETPELSTGEKHLRDCYVVPEEGADRLKIAETIKNMPHYFSDYKTNVTFISEKELKENHSAMPHGGFVIRSGCSGQGGGNRQIMEFSLNLESNPEFTSCVLVAYARAVCRMSRQGQYGAKTIFDIPPAYLSPRTGEELRRDLL